MTLEGGVPDTRFATLGDDRIAYQVFGEGDVDLLYAGATGDPIELRWDWPPYAAYLRRLADRARVVTFDRRGSGSSDDASGEALPGWERWADDALAVLDAVGSERAVVCGLADGGPFSVLFAATHASRTRGLILVNTAASFVPDAGRGERARRRRRLRRERLGNAGVGRVHDARLGGGIPRSSAGSRAATGWPTARGRGARSCSGSTRWTCAKHSGRCGCPRS